MAKSLRDEVEAFIASDLADACEPEYGIVYEKLRAILDRHPIDPEWETGYAQAIEFAQYVEDHAKGAMVDAAKRFLSLPYSQALAKRIAPADGVVVDADIAALRASEPKGMRRLRWLLAMRFSGRNLYRDDGEYSDTSTQPFIDFRRDSVPEIERKMRDRDMQRAKDQADAILAQRE